MIRQFDDVLAPDPRFAVFVRAHDLQPVTFEDHYADVLSVALQTPVSDEIKVVFERARAAFLYSWFSYELTTLAQSQACAALELALKSHLQMRYPGKIFTTLNTCLEKTIADGDFNAFCIEPGGRRYDRTQLTHLRELLVHTRNAFFHGSDMLTTPQGALDIILRCARLIDRLHGHPGTISDDPPL